MSEKKPARQFRLTQEIDASPEAVWKALTEGAHIANWFPPEAESKGTGVGSEVTFAWSEQMRWTTKVDAWEPGKRLRWLDSPSFLGEGTAMASEWLIESAGGKTKLTLVQSGFGGESGAWDDLFAGMEVGWTYFLYNLRVYLERHAGRVRHMISTRFQVVAPRAEVWRKLLSAATGLVIGGSAAVEVGDWVELKLTDPATVRALVEIAIEGHAVAMRVPELGDALFFIELEMGGEGFGIGAYLSVYDAAHAERLESPAQRAFERARAALS